jgi:hypothetical protein
MTSVHDLLGIVRLAQSRVMLATLDTTEPGDVFYLVSDPATVWQRVYPSAHEYPFVQFGFDMWHAVDAVGTGDPRQRVVVVHNTKRKFCAVPAESAG